MGYGTGMGNKETASVWHTGGMQKTESAGGVVMNARGEVVVVNQQHDSWSLPKGHVDSGESAREAAKREIAEECGIKDAEYIRELGSYERYRIGKGGIGDDTNELKHIHMFLFTTSDAALTPVDPANPEARWVPVKEVAALLTHPKDKEFFESIKDSLK